MDKAFVNTSLHCDVEAQSTGSSTFSCTSAYGSFEDHAITVGSVKLHVSHSLRSHFTSSLVTHVLVIICFNDLKKSKLAITGFIFRIFTLKKLKGTKLQGKLNIWY